MPVEDRSATRRLSGPGRHIRTHGPELDAARARFEPLFYNNLVLVVDSYFCHRSRTMEGKNGNPLNEVRVLCNSIVHHDGVMTADKTIRLMPEKSVLEHAVGDVIQLNEADFVVLSKAFFADIESTYAGE